LRKFEIDGENDVLYTVDGNLYGRFGGQTQFLSYAMGNDETKFTMPEGVDTICTGAFSFFPFDYETVENASGIVFVDYYSNLKKVIISEGVKTIQSDAFLYLNSLRSVYLPSTIEYIGSSAFAECRGLSYVEFNGTVAEWEAIEKSDTWFTDCAISVIHCTDGDANPIASTKKKPIKLWVPQKGIYEEQINRFMSEHPEYSNYELIIEYVNEGSACNNIISDIQNAPDLYYFIGNDFEKLLQWNMLASPNISTAEILKNRNEDASVSHVSIANTPYAYPLFESNGIYMYYDKSIITNPESLEQIIADVEAYNKANGTNKFICFNITNAWHNASFFFGAGCHSSWVYDQSLDGFTSVDNDFNSDKGLIAMKGLKKLTDSEYFIDSEFLNSNIAVAITGFWNRDSAENVFGENLGATDLPSFNVDGTDYHLNSFSSYTYIGVKPQVDKYKAAFLQELASYLTNKECQLELYNELKMAPTNRIARQDETIASDIHVSALFLQNQCSTKQGVIPNNWWDYTSQLGFTVSNCHTDDDFRAALEVYEENINGLLSE
jgi:arabinogalactan oligomer/maltooligosaccharide transport system substrate-binding protein